MPAEPPGHRGFDGRGFHPASGRIYDFAWTPAQQAQEWCKPSMMLRTGPFTGLGIAQAAPGQKLGL